MGAESGAVIPLLTLVSIATPVIFTCTCNVYIWF